MNLFASERPYAASDRKALLGHISIVPQIYVFPNEEDEGRVLLTVFLPVEDNTYAPHQCDLYLMSLPEFFQKYRDDPEDTLRDYFAWKPAERKPKVPRLTLVDAVSTSVLPNLSGLLEDDD